MSVYQILKGEYSMKKLISIVCSLVILGVSAFSCFAAEVGGNLNSVVDKDLILSRLKSGFNTGANVTLYLPQEYLNQAENYLNANGDKLTEDQYKEILININQAASHIKGTNAKSFAEIQNDSQRFEKIKAAMEKAASEAGLKITFNGGKSITVTDASGNVVFKTSVDGNIQKASYNSNNGADRNTNYVDEEERRGNDPAGDVIKTTGLDINVTNAAVVSSIIGLLVLASGAVIYTNKLYKHE